MANEGSITNSGDFTIYSSSVMGIGSNTLNRGRFTQSAGSTRVDGTMTQEQINIDGGSLSGTGSIVMQPGISGSANALHIGAGASLEPGNSVGLLDLTGDLDLDGTLSMELESSSSYDVLDVSGTADLTGGKLEVDLLNGYAPSEGDSFDLLLASVILGDSNSLVLPGLGGDLVWQLQNLTDEIGSTDVLRLSVLASEVPIPAAAWLFGSALLGLGVINRKRA